MVKRMNGAEEGALCLEQKTAQCRPPQQKIAQSERKKHSRNAKLGKKKKLLRLTALFPFQDLKPEHINLQVKSVDGHKVFFKIKKTVRLKRLMEAYCKKIGVDMTFIRFLLDGERIGSEQTPQDVSTLIDQTKFVGFASNLFIT